MNKDDNCLNVIDIFNSVMNYHSLTPLKQFYQNAYTGSLDKAVCNINSNQDAIQIGGCGNFSTKRSNIIFRCNF